MNNLIYKDAFNYTCVAIGVMDSHGKFIKVNSKWLNMFGYEEKEIIGLKIDEITHDNDFLKSKYFLDKLILGEIDNYSIEKKYLKKNGDVFNGELSVRRVDNEGELPFNIVGIISDISHRVENSKKLREANIELKVERNCRKKLLKRQERLFTMINEMQSDFTYDRLFDILKDNISDIVGNKGILLIIEDDSDELYSKYIGDNRINSDDEIIDYYNESPLKDVYRINEDYYYNYRIKNNCVDYGSLLIRKREAIEKEETLLMKMLVKHLSVVILENQSSKSKQLKISKLKDLTSVFNKINKTRGRKGISEAIGQFKWFDSIKVLEYEGDKVSEKHRSCLTELDKKNTMNPYSEKLVYYEDKAKQKCFGVLSIDGKLSMGVIFVKNRRFSEIDKEIVKLILEHLSSSFERDNLINSSEEKAMVDSLTGIWNRRYLISKLEKDDLGLGVSSLVLIDLGNFKIVNDLYGHNIGDEVLKFVANIISKNIRESDFVCRFGGDEFLVFLPNTQVDLAEKIIRRLYEKIFLETERKYDYAIYADYGVVAVTAIDGGIMETIKKADEKMYINKRNRKRMELKM